MPVRRDKKNRILWKGEYQRANGMYEYKYKDALGVKHSVYSWRLTQTDRAPLNKESPQCLREMEREIEHEIQDGINFAKAKQLTLNAFFEEYIKNKVGFGVV